MKNNIIFYSENTRITNSRSTVLMNDTDNRMKEALPNRS